MRGRARGWNMDKTGAGFGIKADESSCGLTGVHYTILLYEECLEFSIIKKILKQYTRGMALGGERGRYTAFILIILFSAFQNLREKIRILYKRRTRTFVRFQNIRIR